MLFLAIFSILCSLFCIFSIFYFFFLSYKNFKYIEKSTTFYNLCSEDIFQKKLYEIMIDIGLKKCINYNIYETAAFLYLNNEDFRKKCQKEGVKHRLLKILSVN